MDGVEGQRLRQHVTRTVGLSGTLDTTVHMISIVRRYLCFDVIVPQSVDTSVSHGDTRETLD